VNIFYIYIYLDPRKPGIYKYGEYEFEYEPFYVGKGKGNRLLEIHCGRNRYFKNKINKIENSGLKPIVIKLVENINETESFEIEKQLIYEIGRKDLEKGPLLNFTNGGEGNSGYIPSKETRKKQSNKLKGENHPMFGKRRSEEAKKKQSEKMKGKYLGENSPNYGKCRSDETKKLISEKLKGRYLGENNPFYGKHPSEEVRKLMSEKKKGERHPRSILTKKNIIEISNDLDERILTQKEIAEKFRVDQTTISNIKTGKTWKHIRCKI